MDLNLSLILTFGGAITIVIAAYFISNIFSKAKPSTPTPPIIYNLTYIVLSALLIAIDSFLALYYAAQQIITTSTTDRSGFGSIILWYIYVPFLALISILMGVIFYFILKKWHQKTAPAVLITILIANLMLLLATHYMKFSSL